MNNALFLRFLRSLLRGEGWLSWFLAWLEHLHEWLERVSFVYSVIQLSLRLTPLGSALSVRLRVVSVLQRIKWGKSGGVGTKCRCPFYRVVRLREVPVKRESTVNHLSKQTQSGNIKSPIL